MAWAKHFPHSYRDLCLVSKKLFHKYNYRIPKAIQFIFSRAKEFFFFLFLIKFFEKGSCQN